MGMPAKWIMSRKRDRKSEITPPLQIVLMGFHSEWYRVLIRRFPTEKWARRGFFLWFNAHKLNGHTTSEANQRAEPTLISINNHTDTNEFGEIGDYYQGRERTDKNCYLSLFMRIWQVVSCSFSSLTNYIILFVAPTIEEGKEMFSFDCTLTWVVVIFIQLLRR